MLFHATVKSWTNRTDREYWVTSQTASPTNNLPEVSPLMPHCSGHKGVFNGNCEGEPIRTEVETGVQFNIISRYIALV